MKEHDLVVLTRGISEHRLEAGDIGTIVHRYEDCGAFEVEFTSAEAVEADRRFGKGRHPAGLNFGDCLTYATAHLSGEPLLFVGSDFEQTDIEVD